jgi:hypothetical protein
VRLVSCPSEIHPAAILPDRDRGKSELGKRTRFREGSPMSPGAWLEPEPGPRTDVRGLGADDQVREADGLSVPSFSSWSWGWDWGIIGTWVST